MFKKNSSKRWERQEKMINDNCSLTLQKQNAMIETLSARGHARAIQHYFKIR